MKFLTYLMIFYSLVFVLGACSSIDVDELMPDSSVQYKREKQAERDLAVPPDLAAAKLNDRMRVPDLPGVASNYSEYATDQKVRGIDQPARLQTNVLPENLQVTATRNGDVRWLTVAASADATWDRIIEFWQDQGILLEEQDPQIGIMRTAWLENRANISRDFITDSLRRVVDGLYETGLRDQYRVRLERVANNQTEVYLTHYGMQEELIENSSGESENTVWTPRQRDPELEAVMLRRLMVFLGAADERARAQLAARGNRKQSPVQMVKDENGAKLLIPERFDRSWRLVGLALDQVGFAVEDRNRSKGLYYVRYNDPATKSSKGSFWSTLKFWGSDEEARDTAYQVLVQDAGRLVEVSVLDSQGEPERSDTGVRIINLLREQLQ